MPFTGAIGSPTGIHSILIASGFGNTLLEGLRTGPDLLLSFGTGAVGLFATFQTCIVCIGSLSGIGSIVAAGDAGIPALFATRVRPICHGSIAVGQDECPQKGKTQ